MVKLTLTVGGVKSDYAYDKVTNNVYDYNSYLAAKEMGGEPLMVGKIMEKDGSRSFVKMSAASAAAAAASEPPVEAKSKKPEGGVAVSRKPSESVAAKKVSSAASAAAAADPKDQ